MNSWNQALFRFWDRLKLHFPLRRNFFLFLSIALLLKYMSWDFEHHLDEEGYFFRKNVIDFLLLVFVRVWIAMIVVSLLSLLYSYLHNRRLLRQKVNTKVSTDYDKKSLLTVLKIQFKKIARPILGYLFVVYKWDAHIGPQRLVYKGARDYVSSFELDMPFVKRYHFDYWYLLHLDLFRFFRLNIGHKLNRNLTRRADYIHLENLEVQPALASDDEQNASQSDRAEGEWLRTKKFEPSDDFRRIVWRVYAQNRELVVRRPEIYSPHSSKMNFYVSFMNNESKLMMNDWLMDWFSTRYKNAAWSLFRDLQTEEGIEVKLVSAQNIPNLDLESQSEFEHEVISASSWQVTSQMTDDIYEPGFFVVCISPFISIANLKRILEINKQAWVYLIVPDVKENSSHRWWHSILFWNIGNTLRKNLRTYRWLGLQADYHSKIANLEKVLKENGTNFSTIKLPIVE